jgi:hypothetical protein
MVKQKVTVARGQNPSQKQSQKQNVNVTVNLGEKKKKGKPKKRKTGKKGMKRETQIIPAFNPPSIINYPPFFNQYNQKPNTFLNPPPPIPQKEYSVFPEAETAPLTNILSTVPTILKLQTTEPEPNLAKATTKEPEVQPFALEVAEEPIFTSGAEEPAPTFFNEPETTTPIGAETEANIEPLLTPAEEESYKQLTSQYRAAELPVQQTFNIPSLKELAEKKVILPAGSVEANVAYSPFQLYSAPEQSLLPELLPEVSLLPEEPLSPSGSSISNLTEEPVFLGAPSSSFFNVGGLKLPPLNLPPRQQITGAEEILGGSSSARTYKKKERLPKNEPVYEEPAFLFTEGLTGRTTGEYSAPLTSASLVPTVAEAKEEASTQLETKPKKKSGGKNIELQKASLIGQGFATGGENLPKPTAEPPKKVRAPYGSKSGKTGFNPTQTALAFPAPIAQANDIPSNVTGLLGLPIAEQPNIQLLGGTQKTFLVEPAPPLAPITGGIQRTRAVAIPAAEADIIDKPNIPTLFTQRSQTTL